MRSVTICILVVFLMAVSSTQAAVINIPGDYRDIQLAIERSHEGDTILLGRGLYYLHANFGAKCLTFASHYFTSGDEADIAETILTGNDANGSVLTIEPQGHSVRIIGLTLVQGRAVNGGGIYCTQGSLSVEHCVVQNDSAQCGGGLYARECNLNLVHTEFSSNRAINGGGVYCHSVNLKMTGCSVERNRGFLGSGMIFQGDSAATIDSCLFSGSLGHEDGGGDGLTINGMIEFPEVVVTNCEIRENATQGIVVSRRLVKIVDCSIMRNRHGGVSVLGDVTMVRSLIYNNRTSRSGGGIRVDSFGRTALINSVVYGNEAQTGGGVYTEARDSLLILNSIIWGNTPTAYAGVPYITYTDITGGAFGDGNIRLDPKFVDPDAGDFNLKPDSPCINAATDHFEWCNRIVLNLEAGDYIGEHPDMGVFEFNPNDVGPEPIQLPGTLALEAYPNPFNSSTNLHMELPEAGDVTILISDIQGRVIQETSLAKRQAGDLRWNWSGRNDGGGMLPSGLYLCTVGYRSLSGTESSATVKLTLIR